MMNMFRQNITCIFEPKREFRKQSQIQKDMAVEFFEASFSGLLKRMYVEVQETKFWFVVMAVLKSQCPGDWHSKKTDILSQNLPVKTKVQIIFCTQFFQSKNVKQSK